MIEATENNDPEGLPGLVGDEPQPRKRNRRNEDYGIVFANGCCDGWAFDVCDAFRTSLDIGYGPLVDKEATAAARRKNPKAKAVQRMVWTRGVPPLLSFERGHVFYEPPGVRVMAWGEALKVLRRVLRVTDGAPDGDADLNGWVVFTVEHYEGGRIVRRGSHRCSQAEFEVVLRSGALPAGL